MPPENAAPLLNRITWPPVPKVGSSAPALGTERSSIASHRSRARGAPLGRRAVPVRRCQKPDMIGLPLAEIGIPPFPKGGPIPEPAVRRKPALSGNQAARRVDFTSHPPAREIQFAE